MRLYLDTEYNGHCGELISLALAARSISPYRMASVCRERSWSVGSSVGCAVCAAALAQEGGVIEDHFNNVVEGITAGKGAKVVRKDVELSRRACYLVGINGDPRPDGRHWYGEFELPENLNPWVAEHVVPQLCRMPPTVLSHSCGRSFRASLLNYMDTRAGAVIYADWPDDFAHLMRCMSGPSYEESWMVPCTMRLIVTPEGEPKPEIPHNALSDAIALMAWHEARLRDGGACE